MPENPKPESYIHCEPCSKEAGEPVYYFKGQLKKEAAGFLSSESIYVCPQGHKVDYKPAAA